MSANGNAIDRQDAIKHLQMAEQKCADANNIHLLGFARSLVELSKAVVGEPGSTLTKGYNTIGQAIDEAHKAMLAISDANKKFATLINSSSSRVSETGAAYNPVEFINVGAFTTSGDKKAGVKDPSRAVEIMENEKKAINQMRDCLSGAINQYKYIWQIADEAEQCRERAHEIAESVRRAMDAFANALSEFADTLSGFMTESLSESEKNGSITGEQVEVFNTRVNSFQTTMNSYPKA